MIETKIISKIIKQLLEKNIELTIENITIQSLFNAGGTISDEDAKAYLNEYISIGFCQPKFYKKSTWDKAKNVMELLCKKGLAKPFDYGVGKGKYTSHMNYTKIIELL